MSQYPRILQLDKSGNPKKWIDYEKASYYYCKELVVWEVGVNFTTLYGGINRISDKQSTLQVNSIIAIDGRIAKHQKRASLSNQILFRRDGHICGYCGRQFSAKDLTRDHIHAKTHGGQNEWSNVISACKPCNSHKSDKSIDDAGLTLLYKPYVPTYAEYLFLNNQDMTDDQYQFLIKLIPDHSRVHENFKREI